MLCFLRKFMCISNEYTNDNDDITTYLEPQKADETDAKNLAKTARRLEVQSKKMKKEASKKQSEARKREADAQKLEEKARLRAQALEERGEGSRKRGQNKGARMTADDAQERGEVQKNCRLEGPKGGMQPEVWPTEQEFQLAKDRIKYGPENIHIAVCGIAGSGKSSLINAFRGLKNNSPHAAPTGIVETTEALTRYPDPRKELPYDRLVWFDCPGAGTLENPGWKYFNQQGLFIFDVVILVYDMRFTEIDVSIIHNCERFKIPLFIVRSKADTHIRKFMQDSGYDDNEEPHFDNYQAEARQLLIDDSKTNIKTSLQEAGLVTHDVFIVSSSVIYSLATKSKNKNTPEIDETRLIDSVLKTACERRNGTLAPVKDYSAIIKLKENIAKD